MPVLENILIPSLFILLPLYVIYRYQHFIEEKKVSKNDCGFKSIIKKRYSISSELIALITEKNLLDNSEILDLIALRKESKEIQECEEKLELESKISNEYASLIFQLRMTDNYESHPEIEKCVLAWEQVDLEFGNQLNVFMKEQNESPILI